MAMEPNETERGDAELIADHVRGDESAFPILLERYLKQIYNFALRQCGSSEDAEDIAQETFLKAWKNLGKYRRESAQFRTWLFHIARNTTIDYLRKKKHVAFSEFDTEEGGNFLTETLADEEPLADELFFRAQNAQMIEDSLTKLPPRSREVLLLRYREGLTFDEIGEVLSEPLNTAKSRHRRALQALRNIVEKKEPKA